VPRWKHPIESKINAEQMHKQKMAIWLYAKGNPGHQRKRLSTGIADYSRKKY